MQINKNDKFQINASPYKGKTFTVTGIENGNIDAECGDGISYRFPKGCLEFYGAAVQVIRSRAAKADSFTVAEMNNAPYLKGSSGRKPERLGNGMRV